MDEASESYVDFEQLEKIEQEFGSLTSRLLMRRFKIDGEEAEILIQRHKREKEFNRMTKNLLKEIDGMMKK